MASLNKIVIVGNVLADPETRATVDGLAITKFKMTLSSYPGTETTSIDVVAWKRLAEICGQYLKKGKLILVEGRLQIRSYEDQGGQRKWANEVVASNMQMLDGKTQPAESRVQEQPAEAVSSFDEVEELPEDDLPF